MGQTAQYCGCFGAVLVKLVVPDGVEGFVSEVNGTRFARRFSKNSLSDLLGRSFQDFQFHGRLMIRKCVSNLKKKR